MSDGTIQTFRDLKVWAKGMDLVVRVYKATEAFPKHELYGLTSQLRRASVSVPSRELHRMLIALLNALRNPPAGTGTIREDSPQYGEYFNSLNPE